MRNGGGLPVLRTLHRVVDRLVMVGGPRSEAKLLAQRRKRTDKQVTQPSSFSNSLMSTTTGV